MALMLAVGACSSSTDGATTPTSGTTATPATIGRFESRPVLAVLPPDTPVEEDVLVQVDEAGVPTMAYRLGPGFETDLVAAEPTPSVSGDGRWDIRVEMAPGASGIDGFNDHARRCHALDATCPTGQLAVIVDGRVLSAPRIQPQQGTFEPFEADKIIISGAFDQAGAEATAAALAG